MKITFAFPRPSMTGGCRVVAIYAQALSDAGHQVTIVCPRYMYGGLANRTKRFLTGRLNRNTVLANSHFSGLKDVRVETVSPKKLSDPRKYPNADILIATWWKTVEWIADLPEKKGIQCYFVQHYEAHDEQPLERVWNTYKTKLPKIVIAEWLAAVMANKFGDKDTHLVPNAVEHKDFFRPAGAATSENTFCSMYSESAFKGVDVTLAAFEKVRARAPEIKLKLFGAKALSEEITLPDGVEFIVLPSRDQLREIYASCRAYIFSSRSEGFGLPVLEALACGCPVIATRSGCAPEYIKPDYNGYLNDIDDIAGQANAIERILQLNSSEWQAMSTAAVASVRDCSWTNSARTFENVLDRIVAESTVCA
ncbi:glycosyltransferase family 4 protein [Microbulbifer agarilyticus]|uniref:glycosyltransferase family 4 protein n=1 Tax=Microbulbifer agarilyticus TaxID=260552 RepID=UPI001C978CAE|nr:glycosyltransferase family 4 protein [Microbulbifer agarilyticus]MBY6190730.1 glycosyltransferase family 4 protein [Microbulbifer agarilyticus]